ncbi:MAG: triose-phosphate isomerase [Methylobacteriaceae bacterium]|nr:triose-phosphate isomerase [Methylobacteriaceae bacterium]
MIPRRPLVAGNWKMNGLKASLAELAAIRDAVAAGHAGDAEIVVCPPATLIAAAAELCAGSRIAIGGQWCHAQSSGAHTGDISAAMLKDAGAIFVIVGHSERRIEHAETDGLVRGQAEAALGAGLTAIVCIGETAAERREGRTLAVLERQVGGSVPTAAGPGSIVIAYEPVWAIGTGLTPTPADVADAHAFIRRHLDALMPGEAGAVRILYGGSVKPANAAELLAAADVDGALVGGASLTCKDFMGIAGVYRSADASRGDRSP